jgi:CRP/FNR family cyclic AMP-dependent transcriptional regulator
MNTEEQRAALALSRIPAFAGLDERGLARVAAAARRESYERGAFLLYEGEPCRTVHFVVHGRVRVSKVSPEGREQVLALLRPGEGLNLVAALDGDPNPASAQALTAVEVYTFARDDFLRLVAQVPQVARNILADFSGKLRAMVALVEDLSFRTVGARLARFLLTQGEAIPGRHWTQEEIAAHLGTVREMVGRVLRVWQDAGVVRLERGRVVVLDRAALEEKSQP